VVVGASVVVVDVVVTTVVVGAGSGSTADVVVVGATVVVVDVVVADMVVDSGSTAAVVVASVVAAAKVVVTSGSGAGPAAAAVDSGVSAEADGTGCCGATASGAVHPTTTATAAKKLSPRAATQRVPPSCLATRGQPAIVAQGVTRRRPRLAGWSNVVVPTTILRLSGPVSSSQSPARLEES